MLSSCGWDKLYGDGLQQLAHSTERRVSCASQAKYLSLLIMLVILLSICAMTFASIPEGLHWVDVFSDNVTQQVIIGR